MAAPTNEIVQNLKYCHSLHVGMLFCCCFLCLQDLSYGSTNSMQLCRIPITVTAYMIASVLLLMSMCAGPVIWQYQPLNCRESRILSQLTCCHAVLLSISIFAGPVIRQHQLLKPYIMSNSVTAYIMAWVLLFHVRLHACRTCRMAAPTNEIVQDPKYCHS
jgi:hypothetical protein